MKQIKLILIVLLLLFSIPLVSSASILAKVNQDLNISSSCGDSSSLPCDAGTTTCTLYVKNPAGTTIVDYQTMNIINGQAQYTVASNLLDKIGYYPLTINCVGTTGGIGTGYIHVTPTGSESSVSDSIGSAALVILFLALTVVFGYLGFKLSENDYFWVVGIFFLFFALILITYDLYLGIEYYTNYNWSNVDSTMPQVIFWSFLTLVSFGAVTVVIMLFKNWKKIWKKYWDKSDDEEEMQDDLE